MVWNSVWAFNLGAEWYDWFSDSAAWRGSCARLVDHLPEQAMPRVADLGCGPAVSAIAIARARADAHVAGLDLAGRILVRARRRVARAGLDQRVALVQADALRLPFASGSVDAVTGHSVLYLLPDRPLVLAEALRVLRPGGRIVLLEPNRRPASLAAVLRVSRDPRFLVAVFLWRAFSRLYGRFTAESLTAIVAENGFSSCQVQETLGGLGLLAWAEKPRP